MESENQSQVSKNGGIGFFRTCLNGLNTMAGIGILSMPYAISQGGWLSFFILFTFAMMCWYTALLLKRCMDQHPQIKSYPDIGEVAFGYKGRVVIAIVICMELFLFAAQLLIIEGDNLDKLFPNMSFTVVGLKIEGKKGFVVLTTLVILPTTWLRSLGALAYISVGGFLSSIVLIGCVAWVGEVDGVGFHETGKILSWGGLLSATCIFSFSYGLHSVVPTLYHSMNDKGHFSKVLLVCFVATTVIYGSIAILGYMMFGDDLNSQITLNLPTKKISTKIAIYTTIISPLCKYAVIITPVFNAIEDKWFLCKRIPFALLVRSTIVTSNLLVALFIPFFGYMVALIGASTGVATLLLFPCLCYLKMNDVARQFGLELVLIIGIIVVATLIGILGSYISLSQIVNHMKL